MMISVVLCTYNRCRSLPNALESIAASELPATVEWEIVVVDNHSNDRTPDVVQDFCRRFPGRFRYVFEAERGLSAARNAGIKHAHGEIIAFTDDDLTVDRHWLWTLVTPLTTEPWAGAGGRIRPAEKFTGPSWLALDGPYGMGGPLYAHFDLGNEAHELDRPPYGANMAFRRKVFEKYGAFRTDLGPSPGNEIRNDDTEFGRRLMAAGERLRYEPAAVVYHEIPVDRISKSYFLKWWFDYGRAQIREAGKRQPIGGIPRRYFTIFNLVLSHLPRRIFSWFTTLDPQKRFYRRCMVQIAMGWLVETRRLTDAPSHPRVAQEKRGNKQLSETVHH